MEEARQRALDAYQASLPVRLMATPRKDFSVCTLSEQFASVQRRNQSSSFDFIPVLNDDDENIVGVLAMNGPDQHGELVQDRFDRLHEDLLIGADVSILDFVRKADRQSFCYVVDRRRIGGLVSLSDLQQLPVRAALFAIVTQLEMTMGAVIAELFEGDSWRTYLSTGRQRKLDDMLRQATADHNQVDPLLYTQFCDKADILIKHCDAGKWGLRKADWKKDFDDIQKLRNQLAHGNEFAASSARQVCALVRTMDDWLVRLEEMLRGNRVHPS